MKDTRTLSPAWIPHSRPRSDRLYSRAHTWVKTEGGKARVGISAFLASLLPRLDIVVTPTNKTPLWPGTPCAWLFFDGFILAVPSPVEGNAEENPLLAANPNLLRSGAEGEGYLLEIPAAGATVRLYAADESAAFWEKDREELVKMTRCETGADMAADGGRLVESLTEMLGVRKRNEYLAALVHRM